MINVSHSSLLVERTTYAEKVAYFLVVILIGVIGLEIRSLFFHNPNSPTNTPDTVTVSEAFEVFLHAPLWVAYEKGFFADEGLDVHIAAAGGDEKAWAAVASHEADFAVGDPIFTAISNQRGQQGVVIASILNGMPFWGLTNNPAITSIQEASDLKGYRVGTLPAPSTNYALQKKMFESAGLEPNISEIALGGLLPALNSKAVDIALEFEPSVSNATANGYRIVYSLADYYPDFAFTGLTATPEYVKSHPETVQKMVNALQRANTYIRNNPQEAASVLAKKFNLSESVALSALENLVSKNIVTPDTRTTPNAWQAAVTVRREIGDLTADAPYATYIDTTFSERALQQH